MTKCAMLAFVGSSGATKLGQHNRHDVDWGWEHAQIMTRSTVGCPKPRRAVSKSKKED
jgi:hypothetical protein